jgi:hypothetical protein
MPHGWSRKPVPRDYPWLGSIEAAIPFWVRWWSGREQLAKRLNGWLLW